MFNIGLNYEFFLLLGVVNSRQFGISASFLIFHYRIRKGVLKQSFLFFL